MKANINEAAAALVKLYRGSELPEEDLGPAEFVDMELKYVETLEKGLELIRGLGFSSYRALAMELPEEPETEDQLYLIHGTQYPLSKYQLAYTLRWNEGAKDACSFELLREQFMASVPNSMWYFNAVFLNDYALDCYLKLGMKDRVEAEKQMMYCGSGKYWKREAWVYLVDHLVTDA